MSKGRWAFFAAIFCVAVGATTLRAASVRSGDLDIQRAVVKVIATYQKPDYDQPWQMKIHRKRYGSGCIIEGKRILTNAHIVSDQTYIQVQRARDVRRYTAKIAYSGHGSDLAILTVEDPGFFKGTRPIRFGGMARLRDRVMVCGFPKGGTKLSITEGVVSRIELQTYSHSGLNLLAVQIDAAINSGNSGGPLLRNGRLVGVAFQVKKSGQNIGYVIPMPILHQFMKDVEDGRYDGIPYVGINCQNLKNPFMRKVLKMKPGQTGMYVRKVEYGTSAHGFLKEGDVLLEIGGVPIAIDGTVPFGDGDRIGWAHQVSTRQIGDFLPVTYLRDGKKGKVRIPLKKNVDLVPLEKYDVRPTYYVFAGLVFMPLTENYMWTWGKWGSVPVRLSRYYYYGDQTPDRREVVVLAHILEDDLNKGYHHLENKIISHVNGKAISDLRSLKRAIEGHEGRIQRLRTEEGHRIIVDAKATKRKTAGILKRYGVKSRQSKDLE